MTLSYNVIRAMIIQSDERAASILSLLSSARTFPGISEIAAALKDRRCRKAAAGPREDATARLFHKPVRDDSGRAALGAPVVDRKHALAGTISISNTSAWPQLAHELLCTASEVAREMGHYQNVADMQVEESVFLSTGLVGCRSDKAWKMEKEQ